MQNHSLLKLIKPKQLLPLGFPFPFQQKQIWKKTFPLWWHRITWVYTAITHFFSHIAVRQVFSILTTSSAAGTGDEHAHRVLHSPVTTPPCAPRVRTPVWGHAGNTMQLLPSPPSLVSLRTSEHRGGPGWCPNVKLGCGQSTNLDQATQAWCWAGWDTWSCTTTTQILATTSLGLRLAFGESKTFALVFISLSKYYD